MESGMILVGAGEAVVLAWVVGMEVAVVVVELVGLITAVVLVELGSELLLDVVVLEVVVEGWSEF